MRPEQLHKEPDPGEFFEWAKARGSNWMVEMEHVYGPPECGRNRAVFCAGAYVIKVPLNDYGVSDNEHEGSQDDENYAQCHIVHDPDGFPILFMERVIMVDHSDLPDWADFVDCAQVGLSRKTGSFVAYDFGIH